MYRNFGTLFIQCQHIYKTQVIKIIQQNYSTKSTKAYNDFNIIPDVFEEAPSKKLDVQFKNGVDVNYGDILHPRDVQEPPLLQWEHDVKKYYTLCMIDPDLPSKDEPILRCFQIWLVGNILGQEIDTGETYAEYVGVGPPKNTGYHRYVLFVSEQQDKNDYSTLHKGRQSIPVAGNFFLAQYDNTVPKVYKKLQKC